jgi:ketosteroid isomerase-like protein
MQMKPPIQALVLACVLVLGLPGRHNRFEAAALHEDTAKEQILALDQQLNVAAVNGDLKFFAKVMSDDYVGVAPDGTILRKSLIAEHYLSGSLHYESVVPSEVEVHLHGNWAILTEVTVVKGRDGNTDLSGRYRITRVFLERNGDWQVVAFQATPMRPAAAN